MSSTAQLVDILEQNAALYEELAGASEEERISVEMGLVERLEEVVKLKENLSIKIKLLEETRLKLVSRIAEALGRSAEDITLAEIANHPENRPYKGKLISLRDRLQKVAGRTAETNNFNKNLLSRCIVSVMDAMQCMNNLVMPSETYSQKRRVSSKAGSGRMVSRSF